MKLKIFAVVTLLYSASAFAQDNLISCGTSAGFLFRCAIPTTTSLLSAQSVESNYSLSYQMTCNRNYPGPVASRLRVSLSDGTPFVLNYNDTKQNTVVGTGKGELTLVDSFPKELAGLKYQDCSLKIWDVKASPSAKVVEAWKAEKASLESQIALAAAARDANQSLAVLEASLSVYSKFMDSVLATHLSENDLLAAIADLKSCATAGDDPVTCDRTIDKLASATSLFETAEIAQLTTLQAVLNRVNFSAITCPLDQDCAKAIIKKYLSDDDIALLAKARDQLNNTQGASDKATAFGRQVEVLQSQLDALKEKSKGSIQW